MNILGKRSDLPFSARVIARRRKAQFPLRMCRILFEAKHSWTVLRMSRPLLFCRQLFAGHMVGSWPTKRKKNLLWMIIQFICKQFSFFCILVGFIRTYILHVLKIISAASHQTIRLKLGTNFSLEKTVSYNLYSICIV